MAGEYRLMYVSPERAVMESTAAWLKKVPVSFFAIDEAHCISEWDTTSAGVRPTQPTANALPDRPIAGFTASATQQVRHDIVEQLGLRDPLKSVSSFRRENLRYVVQQCKGGMQDDCVLEAVKRVKDGNVIVYTPTVARVAKSSIYSRKAVSLRGLPRPDGRRGTPGESGKWMSEEVRVLVARSRLDWALTSRTCGRDAAGLPESIEQLYQETGRAGGMGCRRIATLLGKER